MAPAAGDKVVGGRDKPGYDGKVSVNVTWYQSAASA